MSVLAIPGMVILVSSLGQSTFRLYLLSRRRAAFFVHGIPHNAAATTAPRLFSANRSFLLRPIYCFPGSRDHRRNQDRRPRDDKEEALHLHEDSRGWPNESIVDGAQRVFELALAAVIERLAEAEDRSPIAGWLFAQQVNGEAKAIQNGSTVAWPQVCHHFPNFVQVGSELCLDVWLAVAF